MPIEEKPPSDYDGPALGRDDPVWQYYLRESTQRDTDLVDGWNKLAGLFSAVVTAFLIESYKNLKSDADAALVTAVSARRIVDLFEANISREPPPPRNPLPVIDVDGFRPSRNDVVINTLWFFSLALSMSVALIAMLVKEWNDVYRRGNRFTPYYVQARTRQARYKRLKKWGVRKIVRILPVIMHIALGEKWNTLPCEREERIQSTNMALDKLTAQAVVWLVSHSQAEPSVNAAIRAIANVIAGPAFWNHLIKDKLVVLMAQHFASLFKGGLNRLEPVDMFCSGYQKHQMALCSQAIAKISKHSLIQIIQDADPNSTVPERAVQESDCIKLPEAYFVSVQKGLYRLTGSKSNELQASAFCAESSWITSAGRTNQNHLEQQPLLPRLVQFLGKFDDLKQFRSIPEKLRVDLVEALSTETSYMIWELKDNDINNELNALIELCLKLLGLFSGPGQSNRPAQRAIFVEFAVIAALINDYQRIPEAEIDRISKERRDEFGIHQQYMKAHELYKLRYPYPSDSHLTYARQWHAVWIAELCSKNPKYLETHSDALLFVGLSGILRSCRMDPSQFARAVDLFIEQLKLTEATYSNRMSLPFVLISSCDVQSQVAEDILATLDSTQPLGCANEAEYWQPRINLLQALIEHGQWIEFQSSFLLQILRILESSCNPEFKRQCIVTLDKYWFLNSASSFGVYTTPDWRLLIDFNLIPVLIAEVDDPRMRASTISCFAKIARTFLIQNSPEGENRSNAQGGMNRPDPQVGRQQAGGAKDSGSGHDIDYTEMVETLKKLLLCNETLFEILVKNVVASQDIAETYSEFWTKVILLLPSRLERPTGSQPPTDGNSQTPPIPALSTRPLAVGQTPGPDSTTQAAVIQTIPAGSIAPPLGAIPNSSSQAPDTASNNSGTSSSPSSRTDTTPAPQSLAAHHGIQAPSIPTLSTTSADSPTSTTNTFSAVISNAENVQTTIDSNTEPPLNSTPTDVQSPRPTSTSADAGSVGPTCAPSQVMNAIPASLHINDQEPQAQPQPHLPTSRANSVSPVGIDPISNSGGTSNVNNPAILSIVAPISTRTPTPAPIPTPMTDLQARDWLRQFCERNSEAPEGSPLKKIIAGLAANLAGPSGQVNP
ncbi:hypothetical protein RHS04_01528 [Rhizoctonia solani]|uniref:DUF6535 domain-containing protein n=1 Tax=Rhizoctonia solani TaxID=456999 RepID=A0A8H7HCT8_9AGAM|nr:hypothetical protein RHS04_01528 [Rhizoctonia solani]